MITHIKERKCCTARMYFVKTNFETTTMCKTIYQLIAHKHTFCSMAMVEVFMISVAPTAKVIQRQNLGFIRKTVEGCKLTNDPKTYQTSELKNGNFYTIFVVNICSDRLLILFVF